MSAGHVIRLRGPWEVVVTEGRVRHARRFGRPRTLDAGERVWLVCERVPGAAEVSVNGVPVGETGEPGPFAADVTDRLVARNEVVLLVSSFAALGAVALEIRSAAVPAT